jgi:cell division protein FtsQ
MTQKRKISVRKILNTVVTIALICCCITALSSASKIESTKKLSKIEIDISNGDDYRFLDDKKVLDIINNGHDEDVTLSPVNKLDTRDMEHAIATNPWVKDAQVYIDNEHVLHLFITQRTPVTRIFETTGNSYYLDKTLSVMPLSDDYIYYTTIVTNVPPLKDDSVRP